MRTLLLPAVVWIVRGERKAKLQCTLDWHWCEQRCSHMEDWTLALCDMLFFQQFFSSIKSLKSNFKPYISAPQMKLKQFYNNAEYHALLKLIAMEVYCALSVLSDMPTHPTPSPKHVYMCVCLPFFSWVMFSRMSASNNEERDYFDRSSGMLWLEGACPSQSNHANFTFKLMFSWRQAKKSAVLYKPI